MEIIGMVHDAKKVTHVCYREDGEIKFKQAEDKDLLKSGWVSIDLRNQERLPEALSEELLVASVVKHMGRGEYESAAYYLDQLRAGSQSRLDNAD